MTIKQSILQGLAPIFLLAVTQSASAVQVIDPAEAGFGASTHGDYMFEVCPKTEDGKYDFVARSTFYYHRENLIDAGLDLADPEIERRLLDQLKAAWLSAFKNASDKLGRLDEGQWAYENEAAGVTDKAERIADRMARRAKGRLSDNLVKPLRREHDLGKNDLKVSTEIRDIGEGICRNAVSVENTP